MGLFQKVSGVLAPAAFESFISADGNGSPAVPSLAQKYRVQRNFRTPVRSHIINQDRER